MKQESLFPSFVEASPACKGEMPLAEIALALPLWHSYHYLCPLDFVDKVQVGVRVLVPVGGRLETGYFLRWSTPQEPIPEGRLREIEDVLDGSAPLFDGQMLALMEFAADYYFCPLGEVIRAALPAGTQTQVERFVRLTELGRVARQGFSVGGVRGRLLKVIQPEEELSREMLLERVVEAKAYDVRLLCRDGFLETAHALKKTRVRVRKKKLYHCVEQVSSARRELLLKDAPRQRDVYNTLRTHQLLSLS
ncbi:MAG: hypothetical protein AAGJ35_14350, partial [Myxococcota bacterium]